jgi:hypothetical protein
LLTKWREDVERGAYHRPDDPTFASAALSYMQADGERRFLALLLKYFGHRPPAGIGQREVDAASAALFPGATAATRNRQVYSPGSAVLRHAGVTTGLRRPKPPLAEREVAMKEKARDAIRTGEAVAREREGSTDPMESEPEEMPLFKMRARGLGPARCTLMPILLLGTST